MAVEPTEQIINFDTEADSIEQAVFLALGAASTCWESMEGTGEFQSDRAKAIGQDLVQYIRMNTLPMPHVGEERIICPGCGQNAAIPLNFAMHPDSKDQWKCQHCGHQFGAKEHA